MPAEYTQLLGDLMKLLVGLGAMYGTIKTAMNGLKEDVKEIKTDVKDISGKVTQHTTDIALLKYKVLVDRADLAHIEKAG